DELTRALVQRDARVFLRQSVSTPCLSAIRHAEGIWIEDLQRRRYMDLHGNNVHHIGYDHTRLIDAIRRQMDELSFAPGRYTCAPAVLCKVWFAPSGSDAIEMALDYARAATGWFKTISFWDSYHGAGFAARS